MKIVDFETFVRMPAGTIFAPYKPWIILDDEYEEEEEEKEKV